jgi:hypothetical protein
MVRSSSYWRVANNSSNRSPNQARTRPLRSRSPGCRRANRQSPSTRLDRPSLVAQRDEPADVHSRRDHRVPRRTTRVVVAISESEPWRQCGMRSPSTERPKLARRYAVPPIFARVVTGANSLPRSHDRSEAKEPGQRTPVKAASRLRRSRAARALTGLRRSGSGSPNDHGSSSPHPDITRAGAVHRARCT